MEGAFAPWHIAIIGVLVLVFFGGRRLPESARSLGQALRIFKAETRGLRDDDAKAAPAPAVPAAPPIAAIAPEPPLTPAPAPGDTSSHS